MIANLLSAGWDRVLAHCSGTLMSRQAWRRGVCVITAPIFSSGVLALAVPGHMVHLICLCSKVREMVLDR